ncbi:MAG: hypothetical protein KF768_05115 [Phycisphaeraceae bacterium]|nr:hypothetical protein [Phycisphaeraceae bacterium]
MSSIPSNLSRVPNLMSSRFLLNSLNRTNLDLLRVQTELASNKSVTRFSDNGVAASAISILQDRLERGSQRLQNLSAAQGTLNYLDSTLGDATTLVQEAKSIASDQIGITSDAATRANQATVIDGMIRSLFQLANRQTNGLFIFGGSTPTRAPIEELRGGFRYVGQGSGLVTDLGTWDSIPITLGGNNAIGETSGRLRSTIDLDPAISAGTRLSDLNGARALGITRGEIAFRVNGGAEVRVDLSSVDTVADVVNALQSAIQAYEAQQGTTVLGPAGVAVSANSLRFDVAAGVTLEFVDPGTGITAADLGLSGIVFDDSTPDGTDLDPRISVLTPVSALSGLTLPLGSVRFRFGQGTGSQISDVDLSSAQTVGDIISAVQAAVPGVRMAISSNGRGLDIFNEVSGPSLSIEEVPGGANTATELGIRSLNAQTSLSEFNNGRGIRIVTDRINPQTGIADRTYNTDFRITLGNGQFFDVDLRPQDTITVQALIDRINSEFVTAIGQPPLNPDAPPLAPGDFSAGLTNGANGIALTQTVSGGPIAVEKLNNSAAAEDLGFLNGSYDSATSTLIAQDRAQVRVNNLFTTLIELRDALRANNSSGITVAGEDLERANDRLAQARALVGVHANRVIRAVQRQEDLITIDEQMRSSLQDVDYSEASIRFSLLQTQLQAALRSGAISQNLTLLDFLR